MATPTTSQIQPPAGPKPEKVIVKLIGPRKVAGYTIGETVGVHPEVAKIYLNGIPGVRPPCAELVGDGKPKRRDRSRDQIDGRADVARENVRLTILLKQQQEENDALRARLDALENAGRKKAG